jgi:hypothetical protein
MYQPGKGVHPMTRVRINEEILKMRFEDVYGRFIDGKITTEEAASLLNFSSRTFLRKRNRYEEEDFDGQFDRRLGRISGQRALDKEIEHITKLYQDRYYGYNVRHFHSIARRNHGVNRSYSWTKNKLIRANLVTKGTRGGKHRLRRERRPMAGMMLHQDGSRHLWIPDLGYDIDLIVTMDDATSQITSAFFVEEEGTLSTLMGLRETIGKYGLFCSLYTDRGSHYFYTPEAGGKVDKNRLTHVGRVLRKLGIQHIESYCPQGRGRSERMFGTLQGRLPLELKSARIKTLEAANRYLKEVYLPRHNAEFMVKAQEEKRAYIPWIGNLDDIMCYEEERVVHLDNTVSYNGLTLQIGKSEHRHHYVRTRVVVKEYLNGTIAIFHGPLLIGRYNRLGKKLDRKAA